MFGNCGKLPVAASCPGPDGFHIAVSCCLSVVRNLENITQAFDGILASPTGDIVEMKF